MRNILLASIFILSFLSFTGTGPYAASVNVPDNFRTIQEAVEKAAPYDTVIINDGVYNENILVKKPLTIKSVNGAKASVVIARLKTEPVIKISDTSGVTVSGLAFTGSKVSGILVSSSRGVKLTGNKATENGNGIILYHSKDNTVVENTANANENYGIYLEASSGNILEKNTANSNGDKGLFISYSNDNRVIENNANLNTWNGIIVWSSHRNVISNNRTLRNAFGLVLSDSDDNSLEGNTTLPNIFIILPIVLIYLGIMSYLVQKNILRLIYR